MSSADELRETIARSRGYIENLKELLRRYEVRSLPRLVGLIRTDPSFRDEWQATWRKIADQEGGKLSLTTAGAILGATLGGVGIAAMGGAIGLSLAALLGLGGFVVGMEIDYIRRFRESRRVLLGIPQDLYARIEQAAEVSSVDSKELIISVLAEAFPEESVRILERGPTTPDGV